MPDPGLSPLQSSLPAAAARFGAHVLAHAHASGTEAAVGDARPALPSGPALPFVPVFGPGAVPATVPVPGESIAQHVGRARRR